MYLCDISKNRSINNLFHLLWFKSSISVITNSFNYTDFWHSELRFQFRHSDVSKFKIEKSLIKIEKVLKNKSSNIRYAWSLTVVCDLWFFYFNVINENMTLLWNERIENLYYSTYKLCYQIDLSHENDCLSKQFQNHLNDSHISVFFHECQLIIFREHVNQREYCSFIKFFCKLINIRRYICIMNDYNVHLLCDID